MLKERIKGIIIGVLIGIMLMGSLSFAKNGSQWIEAVYSDIKIVINGKATVPMDAEGNVIEPFINNGTTYLPVRAISSALNKKVEWNADTKTVEISDVSEVIAANYEGGYCDPEKYVKSPYSAEVIFEATGGDVTNFKIVEIELVGVDEGVQFNRYKVVNTIYEKELLEQDDYIVTGVFFAGYGPHFAMIYTDNNGNTKTIGVWDGDQSGKGTHRLNLDEINLSYEQTSQDAYRTSKLLLTEDIKEYLIECCYRIPDFNENDVKTEKFVSDFVYYFYTSKEYERTEQNDDGYSRVPWEVAVVKNQYKLLFGYDMPEYNPGKANAIDYKGIIYEDGKYYVAPSNFGEVEYTFNSAVETDDGVTVIFNSGFTYDCVGYLEEYFYGTKTITLKKADNENGFVITSVVSIDADGNAVDSF